MATWKRRMEQAKPFIFDSHNFPKGTIFEAKFSLDGDVSIYIVASNWDMDEDSVKVVCLETGDQDTFIVDDEPYYEIIKRIEYEV
jgi:hypothetical protein